MDGREEEEDESEVLGNKQRIRIHERAGSYYING